MLFLPSLTVVATSAAAVDGLLMRSCTGHVPWQKVFEDAKGMRAGKTTGFTSTATSSCSQCCSTAQRCHGDVLLGWQRGSPAFDASMLCCWVIDLSYVTDAAVRLLHAILQGIYPFVLGQGRAAGQAVIALWSRCHRASSVCGECGPSDSTHKSHASSCGQSTASGAGQFARPQYAFLG